MLARNLLDLASNIICHVAGSITGIILFIHFNQDLAEDPELAITIIYGVVLTMTPIVMLFQAMWEEKNLEPPWVFAYPVAVLIGLLIAIYTSKDVAHWLMENYLPLNAAGQPYIPTLW